MTETFFSGDDFIPHHTDCPVCGNTYFKNVHWKRSCLPCYLKRKTAGPQVHAVTGPGPIPADMLKRLVYLVHPDKHGNSEASNVATRYLLSLRGGQHE